ncbi:hypothetical protein O3P69_012456 [Scylla paramamosain]|uniref:Uncharacterized protein n=1 Tax=Scylla paramamosain TaxID=85552 RepID=A0AAW0SDU4_SCYPA
MIRGRVGKFMTRCCLFCMLWLVTDYMHIYSLQILDCTDVMALYSAHVSFVYLLSWVILHDQFVSVRRRTLEDLDMKSYRAAKKPLLTPAHKAKKSQICSGP